MALNWKICVLSAKLQPLTYDIFWKIFHDAGELEIYKHLQCTQIPIMRRNDPSLESGLRTLTVYTVSLFTHFSEHGSVFGKCQECPCYVLNSDVLQLGPLKSYSQLFKIVTLKGTRLLRSNDISGTTCSLIHSD